jgi:hypothetical protein
MYTHDDLAAAGLVVIRFAPINVATAMAGNVKLFQRIDLILLFMKRFEQNHYWFCFVCRCMKNKGSNILTRVIRLVLHNFRKRRRRRRVAAALGAHDAVNHGHADARQVALADGGQHVGARRVLGTID